MGIARRLHVWEDLLMIVSRSRDTWHLIEWRAAKLPERNLEKQKHDSDDSGRTSWSLVPAQQSTGLSGCRLQQDLPNTQHHEVPFPVCEAADVTSRAFLRWKAIIMESS